MTIHVRTLDTPIGPMLAGARHDGRLVGLLFLANRTAEEGARLLATPGEPVVPDTGQCHAVAGQLAEYFRGARREFELELAPRGTTFQQRVWDELRRIPCGQTVSYRVLAERVGSPGASRAVGRANALNPVAIIIPCHRVIGSDGTLTGYAGGLEAKERLLELEGARTLAVA